MEHCASGPLNWTARVRSGNAKGEVQWGGCRGAVEAARNANRQQQQRALVEEVYGRARGQRLVGEGTAQAL